MESWIHDIITALTCPAASGPVALRAPARRSDAICMYVCTMYICTKSCTGGERFCHIRPIVRWR